MDVEKRLILAAASLKREVAGFDGEGFSKQLYAKLGISPRPDAMDQGSGGDHRVPVAPCPRGHGDQGQDH